MNALIRTVIITLLLVAVNLVMAEVLPAQEASNQEVQQTLAEREGQIAQRQAEVAQKQAQSAQKRAEVEKTQTLVAAIAAEEPARVTPRAVAPVPPTISAAPARAVSFSGSWPFGSSGTGSVLVIPAAELKIEELALMNEDMSVMSRIFEKNLEQARVPTARGGLFLSSHDSFNLLLGSGGGVIQSMYMQGYAALFLMKVDFPLSPTPEVKEEKQPEKEQQGDPVWEQMRKDMYEPREAERRKTKEPRMEYDAEKVENLKTTLVKALKHAANIRSLKQDESVILTVLGTDVSAGGAGTTVTRGEIVTSGHSRIVQQLPSSSSSSQTVLIIRAKKSDIDSFAKNTLDYEQFRQRIQLLSCACLGTTGARGDPFGRYP